MNQAAIIFYDVPVLLNICVRRVNLKAIKTMQAIEQMVALLDTAELRRRRGKFDPELVYNIFNFSYPHPFYKIIYLQVKLMASS